jgi:predicted short-subunit dehydrogenase-like oxidoreductase (DUF2520 family)
VGYCSRNPESAQEAARFTESRAFTATSDLIAACDLVFLAVPDGVIAPTWESICHMAGDGTVDLRGKCIAHCSGALASTVLAGAQDLGAFGYSVHPLFAVSSKTETYRELPKALFTVEGAPQHMDDIVAMLRQCGNQVQEIAAADKVRYHAAAVMASNLVVGLYQTAADQLERCGFSHGAAAQALAPLFLGNAEHIAHDGPAAALTGPAERGDTATIDKHLACLEGDDREMYQLITKVLYRVADEKHGAATANVGGAA